MGPDNEKHPIKTKVSNILIVFRDYGLKSQPFRPGYFQDYFWTFTGKAWKTKHISLDNIDAEALVAAKAYVEQLVATGILEWADLRFW